MWANLVHCHVLSRALLADRGDLRLNVSLLAWQGLADHGNFLNLLDDLHMRYFHDLLDSGDVWHINLLHNWYIHNLLDGLDHWHLHMPLAH